MLEQIKDGLRLLTRGCRCRELLLLDSCQSLVRNLLRHHARILLLQGLIALDVVLMHELLGYVNTRVLKLEQLLLLLLLLNLTQAIILLRLGSLRYLLRAFSALLLLYGSLLLVNCLSSGLVLKSWER